MALKTSTEPEIPLPAITAAPAGGTTSVIGFDPEDPDKDRWFAPDARSAVLAGNEVIPYIRSEKLYADIVAALRTATAGEHFIFIAGWNMSDAKSHGGQGADFQLVTGDATTSLDALFTAASKAGARLRVMLFKHDALSGARDNSELVTFVSGLANGMAVLDDHVVAGMQLIGPYLAKIPGFGSHYVGAHHQKIIVVSGSEGLVAFQGGYDLDPDRISLGGGPGLHDVHTRVRGPAAKALADAFIERWNDHPSVPAAWHLPAVPAQAALPDNKFVQVAHTFPNTAKHPLVGGGGYGFLTSGERTVKDLLIKAIGAARKFIYVEDQYLFDMDIASALKAALPSIEKLIILITSSGSIVGETLQPWARRKRVIDALPASYTATPPTGGATPTPGSATYTGKVAVCQLGGQYVHAKTWIFDDRFAVIGSANLNRRGMSHDSEQACGIFDTNAKKRWCFAHELRMNLWAKHFGKKPIDFQDPIASSVHWFAPFGGVATYNPDGGVDPDPAGLAKLQAAFSLSKTSMWAISQIITPDVMWDTIIDPDGA